MHICIGLVVPQGQDVMFYHVVFAFACTSVQALPLRWKRV